jgi:CheY-like chemotaxis protein
MNHIPLVVLTGSTEVDDRKAAEALGVTGYLRKPVTFEELVAIARDVVKVFETGG